MTHKPSLPDGAICLVKFDNTPTSATPVEADVVQPIDQLEYEVYE
jgi:hypothetical protein